MLLIVLDSGVGSAGSKKQRYLQIAGYEYREQKSVFYQIVKEREGSDRTIGSTYLKDIGRVSEGKEKRLIEESGKWLLKCRIKGYRMGEEADGKKVRYVLDEKTEMLHPEKAGVIVKENHFYGFIVYPCGVDVITHLDALTEGDSVGYLCIDGAKDGVTEICAETDFIPIKGEGLARYYDMTYTYLLEKNQ